MDWFYNEKMRTNGEFYLLGFPTLLSHFHVVSVRGGKLHRGLVLTAVLSVWHSFAGDEKQHRLGTAKAIEHRNGQLLCDGFQTLWTEGCFRKEERRLNSLADTHFAACRSTEAFAGLSWYVLNRTC